MSENTERAVLAGGCYWIMQQLLRHREGVISTRVGWSGGEGDNPTETNSGGHAEAIEIIFDASRLTYRDLLEYFFAIHRPDLSQDVVSSIYRSEIFYTSDKQRVIAEQTIRDIDASHHWPGRIMTRVSRAGHFFAGAESDQDYLQRFSGGYREPFRSRDEPAQA